MVLITRSTSVTALRLGLRQLEAGATADYFAPVLDEALERLF
jgi:hypothetical protein